MTGVLAGMKVLDFSMGVAGPYAALMCAQHGAEVIKIEPSRGDWGRYIGVTNGDLGGYFTVYNRGKKSAVLDLKAPEEFAVAAKLAAGADIIFESFRPKVMSSLKLDFEFLRKVNPKVVYVSISGFGQEGARSGYPATDSIAQGYSGFIATNKDERGRPMRHEMIVMDVVTGLYAFQSVLAGVMARMQGQEGRYIDCNLLQSSMAFQACRIADSQMKGGAPHLAVPVGVFETADGFLNLSANQAGDHEKLCEALERPDLLTHEKFGSRAQRTKFASEFNDLVAGELRKQMTATWIGRFIRLGIKHSPVWNYSELLADDEVKNSEWVQWFHQDGIPNDIPMVHIPGIEQLPENLTAQAPHLGQHTKEVVSELWGSVGSKSA